MTAMPLTQAESPTSVPYRLRFRSILRSEWIRLATLRSTWWAIAILAVLTIGISLLFADAMSGPADDGVAAVVASVSFTMLLAGTLGAIAVTGEYSTGMILTTLTSDPARGRVLLARATVVAALILVSTAVLLLVATIAVISIVEARGHPVLWAQPEETWLPLLAAVFSMVVFALIGVATGFVLRRGAAAIGAVVALLLVLPTLVSIIRDESSWLRVLGRYLPMPASQNLFSPQSDWGLEWPVALVTLCGWAVVAMLSAWAALRMRDA